MTITYGLVDFDRSSGTIESNMNLPVEDVPDGTIYEFLKYAGEKGWELCASFPSARRGAKHATPGRAEYRDPADVITFVFKRVS